MLNESHSRLIQFEQIVTLIAQLSTSLTVGCALQLCLSFRLLILLLLLSLLSFLISLSTHFAVVFMTTLKLLMFLKLIFQLQNSIALSSELSLTGFEHLLTACLSALLIFFGSNSYLLIYHFSLCLLHDFQHVFKMLDFS